MSRNTTVKSTIDRGIEVSWGAEHRSGDGELISVQRKRGRWFLYFFGDWDRKRAGYCEAHRHDDIPIDFRTGEFSLKSIIFTLELIKQGVWHGL